MFFVTYCRLDNYKFLIEVHRVAKNTQKILYFFQRIMLVFALFDVILKVIFMSKFKNETTRLKKFKTFYQQKCFVFIIGILKLKKFDMINCLQVE